VLAKCRMNNIHPDLKIRNQQVSGSSPERGSMKTKKFLQNDCDNGWYFGWYS